MGANLSILANTGEADSDLTSRHPDQLFVKILVNKKCVVDAHLKTCSTYNFIHPELADELGLLLATTDKEVMSMEGKVTKYEWKCCLNLKVPGSDLKVNSVECVLRDPSEPSKPLLTLGHDFLRNFKYVSLVYGGDHKDALAFPHGNVSVIDVMINRIFVPKVHIYSAQNQSLMSVEFANKLKLSLCYEVDSFNETVMFTLVTLSVGVSKHHQFRFQVVENLHTDVLLGVDFLAKHRKVKFLYGGSRFPRLKVTHSIRKDTGIQENINVLFDISE